MKPVTNRQLILLVLGIIGVMFLYLERSTLTPFILAAIFAYVFNPVATAIARYLHLHKAISILLIYLILIGIVAGILGVVGGRLLGEAKEIAQSGTIDQTAQQAINALPDWNIGGETIGLKASASQILDSTKRAADSYITHTGPIFNGILRSGIGILVFFVAGFYILRDWTKMRDYLQGLVPARHKTEFSKIGRRVSNLLGRYLRGQIVLIVIMASSTFIILEILGVTYALTLAIVSGFLEIIPYVGPVSAAALAGGAAFFNGQNRFALDPTVLTLIVLGSYLVLRHIEDYFVIPALYERLTKLHPVIVIFSILAGGHLFGAIGLILAVPVAASLKVILEYLLNPASIDL